jgi:hypothetical protein
VTTDDITMSSSSDLAHAVERLRMRAWKRNRDRLNEVVAQVYLTHRGRPAEMIASVLKRKATSVLYEPTMETLRPAAEAISRSNLFTFT